jgi:beta-lactamase regulating signal transducer with metallopeptidase domain
VLSAIINHLWQSTLFAVGAGVLTLLLRHNSAGIRFGLWFSASVKFLLPFTLLSALGSRIPHQQLNPVTNTGSARVIGMAIDRIVAPIPSSGQVIDAAHSGAGSMHVWLGLIAIVWACGALGIACHWLTCWSRIRRLRLASTPISMDFPIPVRTSRAMQEPAIAGIVRPVLLLPEGIEDWLSTEQLRAILAHERCHIRRRDNLKAALHMVVEALFWFHPLVWWLETRLVAERERACDEQVLADGNDAHVYAEGIVRICQYYLDSPLRCAAGVGGGNLAKRIDFILSPPGQVRLSALQVILLSGMASAAVAGPIVSGHLETPDNVEAAAVDPQWQAAVRLPRQVWERLRDSDDPANQEMFRRNAQLSGVGGADKWGADIEARIAQFFAEPSFTDAPEAVGSKITVACHETQCQIQVSAPPQPQGSGEVHAQMIIDDLRRQPWFPAELVVTVGTYGGNNGREFGLQYFDRKSNPFAYSESHGLAIARAGSEVVSDRRDIYQLILDQHKAYPGYSRWLASFVHAHEKVARAEDDPEWARPMERRLREAIAADPAGESLEVSSVSCRKTGCELQFFDDSPSFEQTNLPAWIQIEEHLRKSELGAALEMDANFGSKYGNRVMYLTTFKRKPNEQ